MRYFRAISRRNFFRLIGSLSILIGSAKLVKAEERAECMSASSHSKETVLAISDVIVPGAKNSFYRLRLA